MADDAPKLSKNPYPTSPATADPEALEFEPFQPMVKWFTPSELTRAGAESLISTLFGAYADNRELQAVRGATGIFDYSVEPPCIEVGDYPEAEAAESEATDPPGPPLKAAAATPDTPPADAPVARTEVGEMWIDYVADLGDGWDSTYAIASLLAAPDLEVGLEGAEGPGVRTQRGRVLVLGGDQVYPTAKKEEYQNRFAGPYRAALPFVRTEDTPPHLYALPGNHDWYDGLTSFTRLFCQNRWIGGWATQQNRSYFAIQLPGNWWIWGVDIQLSSDIDQPQKNYFEALGKRIPKGAQIILCIAEPVWTSAGNEPRMEAYDNLAWLEGHTMAPYGHRHVVGLAGDLHCYARWASDNGRQRFVSGGGGAYLYPTHRFPERLRLPVAGSRKPKQRTETFDLGTSVDATGETKKALFPEPRVSGGLALRVLLFPFLNVRFSVFFGAFYLFLAWLVQSASKSTNVIPQSFLDQLVAASDFGLHAAWLAAYGLGEILSHAPLAFLTALVLLGGLTAFADGTSTLWKLALGALHTLAHLIAFLVLSWGFAQVNHAVLTWARESGGLRPEWAGMNGVLHAAMFSVEMLTIGGLVAGLVWAGYLLFAHGCRRHTNDVFASQSLADYKHFLRLHIDPARGLTIYPIGVRDVPKGRRRWTFRPNVKDGGPWFVPTDGPIETRAHLIEPPIHIPAALAKR